VGCCTSRTHRGGPLMQVQVLVGKVPALRRCWSTPAAAGGVAWRVHTAGAADARGAIWCQHCAVLCCVVLRCAVLLSKVTCPPSLPPPCSLRPPPPPLPPTNTHALQAL
jgi:hypothetical protein